MKSTSTISIDPTLKDWISGPQGYRFFDDAFSLWQKRNFQGKFSRVVADLARGRNASLTLQSVKTGKDMNLLIQQVLGAKDKFEFLQKLGIIPEGDDGDRMISEIKGKIEISLGRPQRRRR